MNFRLKFLLNNLSSLKNFIMCFLYNKIRFLCLKKHKIRYILNRKYLLSDKLNYYNLYNYVNNVAKNYRNFTIK